MPALPAPRKTKHFREQAIVIWKTCGKDEIVKRTYALLGVRYARDLNSSDKTGRNHSARALNVVVEAAEAIPITVEEFKAVVVGEVLKLKQRGRP